MNEREISDASIVTKREGDGRGPQESEEEPFLPPMQNILSTLDLVCKLSRPGAPIVDVFGSSDGLLGLQRRVLCLAASPFFGCEIDKDLFKGTVQGLVKICVTHVLNSESDISVSNGVVDACKVVLRPIDVVRARKCVGA